METFWKESPSHSTVKKWAADFKRGRERALRMMDGLATLKMTPLMKMPRSCTSWLCERRRDLRSIASEVSIRLGAVQSILTDILSMSKVSARWAPRMLTIIRKGLSSIF